MKQEDIISMAREAAQAPDRTDKSVLFFGLNGEQMFRFAALVAAAEREACAKFFDDNDTNMFWGSQAAQYIKERGNT